MKGLRVAGPRVWSGGREEFGPEIRAYSSEFHEH